jgi:primosomal protein N' (replication factor Y)
MLFPEAQAVEPPASEGPSWGQYANVAVNRPVRCEFTYGVPEEMVGRVARGMRVAVPFGPKREVGVVVGLGDEPPAKGKAKALAAVLDEEAMVGEDLLALTRWMGTEYACSWGEALLAVLPAALKREKGEARVVVVSAAPGVGDKELAEVEVRWPQQHRLLRTLIEIAGPIEKREIERRLNLSDSPVRSLARRGWVLIERVAREDDLMAGKSDRSRPERLTDRQRSAVDALLTPLVAREHAGFLLEGVTGSGKTEVYLEVIERALAIGRGAIVLVPEIALTPQTVGWFRSRFEHVAVLHSRMTDAQRLRMWRRVSRGEARVVVGARSAIFAPVKDLGVVVVDEEHEPSFKQGSVPRYHARDVALRRAREAGAVCVLGSATPSLESWQAAREGRLTALALPERISGHGFPPIEVVDMRTEPTLVENGRGTRLFSKRLADLLRAGLAKGEQSILFLNRRGFSPVLWCSGCKTTVRCDTCDVGLTWHRNIRRLVCHICCEERPVPGQCPTCSKPGLHQLGAGSERVEQELGLLLPEARLARMDSDTMRRREDYEEVLGAFGKGEIDLLVGTQMIAKGLDFPRVTLVGIVNADSSLHLPDFRSAERTFQLISQVAGRAGRGDLTGRIIVQTTATDHYAIQHAAAHDYTGFATRESGLREELGYPPHARMVRVLVEDLDERLASEGIERAAHVLRQVDGVAVLGPAPAPIAMMRGRHRRHIMVKTTSEEQLDRVRAVLIELSGEQRKPRLTIDVDPVSVL